MAYTRRKFNSHIKSLVHFDYPYFNEPADGCRDEINGDIFTRHGNIKFAGSEIPCDEIIAGTPKFGYRCIHSQSNADYIAAMNTGNFDIKSSGSYELECYVKISSSSAGNIITFINNQASELALSVNADNKIILTSSGLNINLTGNITMSINEWHHVKAKMQSGNAELILDGENIAQGEYSPADLTVSEIRIGGISGYIDEFIMRDTITENAVPSEPYQGTCDILKCGGFGTGTTNADIRANIILNSYASVSKVSGNKITLSDMTHSVYSDFEAGTEIMFHVSLKRTDNESDLGLYAFRKIMAVSGNIITLDSAVTEEFNLESCSDKYYVQAITVPNFKTFTLNAGYDITPVNWSGNRGGIIIMRVLGNCTVNGRILSSGYGPYRIDKIQMTHSELINRFMIHRSGGVIIICGGRLTLSADARTGASWDGSAKGGQSGGGCGGAGYGGGGGSDGDNHGQGGYGGVGGGGGGADGRVAGSAGNSGTGGDGAGHDRPASAGATAGIDLNSLDNYNTGGGGAGGHAGNAADGAGGMPGASVILIAKQLHAEPSAISTGGQGGQSGCANAPGGGGTGFAYIACEEMN